MQVLGIGSELALPSRRASSSVPVRGGSQTGHGSFGWHAPCSSAPNSGVTGSEQKNTIAKILKISDIVFYSLQEFACERSLSHDPVLLESTL